MPGGRDVSEMPQLFPGVLAPKRTTGCKLLVPKAAEVTKDGPECLKLDRSPELNTWNRDLWGSPGPQGIWSTPGLESTVQTAPPQMSVSSLEEGSALHPPRHRHFQSSLGLISGPEVDNRNQVGGSLPRFAPERDDLRRKPTGGVRINFSVRNCENKFPWFEPHSPC